MELERYGQPKGSNGYLKNALSRGVQQRIGTFHYTDWGLQNGAAGVTETLARANQRLLTDDALATHFLAIAAALGDFPVACHQLSAMWTLIVDGHCVAKHVARLAIVRLISAVARDDADVDR